MNEGTKVNTIIQINKINKHKCQGVRLQLPDIGHKNGNENRNYPIGSAVYVCRIYRYWVYILNNGELKYTSISNQI